MTRKANRWLWALVAGVLFVPFVAVGAIADTSTATDRGDHVKQSLAISHIRSGDAATTDDVASDEDTGDDEVAADDERSDKEGNVDRSMSREEHEAVRAADCDPLIETDHEPFETDAEHKAFHGIPTDIDHTNDPVFASAADHKLFHGVPCGVGDPADRELGHEGDAEGDTTNDLSLNRDEAGHSAESSDTDGSADDATELKEQPLDRTGTRSQGDKESSEDRSN